jgi:hypothetical protein
MSWKWMWFSASVHQELGEPARFANLFCKLLDFMIIVHKVCWCKTTNDRKLGKGNWIWIDKALSNPDPILIKSVVSGTQKRNLDGAFLQSKSMLFSRYLQIAQFSELQSTIMINPKTTKMFPDSFDQRLLVHGTGIYTDVCFVIKSTHQM